MHLHIRSWFIVFLIWPFGTLIKSFSWIRTNEAKNLFWLFCIYFGFTFIVEGNYYTDSVMSVIQLQEMHASGISINELAVTFYESESGEIDIVHKLVTFLVSRFTSNYRILFAVFGLIFGYFYSRNIWILIRKSDTHLTIFPAILLMSFIMVNGIWNINIFRFYTAAQIFIYGIFAYFLEGKKYKLLFAAIAVLMHWSFLIPLTILFLYFLLRNHSRIYFVLFVLSFFISALNMDIIRFWFEGYAPAIIQETRSGYLSESYQEVVNTSYIDANWFLRGHEEIMKWFVFVSFSLINLRSYNIIKENKQLIKLYNFSLLFYATVNIFGNVASMGRFYTVANMLSLAFLFLYIQIGGQNYPSWLKKLSILPLAIFILVKFRFCFEFMGYSLLVGNPITAIFIENETSLIDLIK